MVVGVTLKTRRKPAPALPPVRMRTRSYCWMAGAGMAATVIVVPKASSAPFEMTCVGVVAAWSAVMALASLVLAVPSFSVVMNMGTA